MRLLWPEVWVYPWGGGGVSHPQHPSKIFLNFFPKLGWPSAWSSRKRIKLVDMRDVLYFSWKYLVTLSKALIFKTMRIRTKFGYHLKFFSGYTPNQRRRTSFMEIAKKCYNLFVRKRKTNFSFKHPVVPAIHLLNCLWMKLDRKFFC